VKNTTKLRNLLQLYTISLDMDEEDNFHLTLIHKTSGAAISFAEKAYTVVVGKAFSHMVKELKAREKILSGH
jgi:hypothetical protein